MGRVSVLLAIKLPRMILSNLFSTPEHFCRPGFQQNTDWSGWLFVNALSLWDHNVSRLHLGSESLVASTVEALGTVDRRLSGEHCRSWRRNNPCQQCGFAPTFPSPSLRIRCYLVLLLQQDWQGTSLLGFRPRHSYLPCPNLLYMEAFATERRTSFLQFLFQVG